MSSENLESKVGELADTGRLPATVAISNNIRDYGEEKVLLTFERYSKSHCESQKLQGKEIKQLIDEFRKVTSVETKQLRVNGLCRLVGNTGGYSPLYRIIPPDAQLLEIEYSKAGRAFGYLAQNILNIVAIKKKHL
jgi:hypothetical protein